MMSSKNIINLFLLAAAFVSCSQLEDPQPPVEENEGDYAYTFRLASDAVTKTSYGFDHVMWENGDLVASYAKTSLNKSTPVQRDGDDITITIRSGVALKGGDVVYAYYPHSSRNDKAEATAVKMEIPRNQVSGDADAMPMVALPFTLTDAVNSYENTEVGTLEFMNLGSVIQLNVYSSNADFQGETIENISFQADAPVSGTFTYDITSLTEENPAAISGYEQKDVVVSGRGTVGANAAGAASYYMVVAPGEYSGKFVVRTNRADYTYTSDKTRTYSRAGLKPLNIDLATTNWVINTEYDTSIDSPREFYDFLRGTSSSDTETYTITANLDMTGYDITSASGFGGTLDGDDFTISNLVSDVPLFEENAGTIKNFVLDESCVFTAGTNVFAPIVKFDKRGTYESVRNRASVTYTATADVEQEIILGGIVAIAERATFDSCSNGGAVTFEATGYNHKAATLGGLVGLVDNQNGKSEFLSCVNRGKITLNAKCGDPLNNFTYGGSGNGRGNNLGGICGTSSWGDEITMFDQCNNETAGTISLYHSDISGLATSTSSSGTVGVAGILGMGQGEFNKCRNYALISVKSLVTGEPSDESLKRRNYLLYVAGIAGCGWDYMKLSSCTNSGNIEVEHYGLYDADDRWRSGIGGICAYGVHNNSGTYAYYCKNEGDITVTGSGTAAVGGIFGYRGKQIKNTVTSDCTITVNCRKGDVGGLAGYLSGGADHVSIAGCECYATIYADSDWGSAGKDWYVNVGGLIGRWGGASNGSSNPALKNRDGDPCVFDGVVSTPYQSRVGVVVGYVTGGTNQFGEKDNPIKVYGSIQKNGLAKTEITPGNIDTYKCGLTKGTTTIYASCSYSFIKVMSFNIRESKWEERQSAVLEMLNTEKPDIIGLQELKVLWGLDKLTQIDTWKVISQGVTGYQGYRPDGQTNGFIYNPEVFEVSNTGLFYLGDDYTKPGVENSWDNWQRTTVYATLKHKDTGKNFFFIATHYPINWDPGCFNSTELIVERLSALNTNKYPVIMVGDFNCTKSSGALAGIEAFMRDARTYADTYYSEDNRNLYTYNAFGDESKARHKVDFIWYSHPALDAKYYEVITQETKKYGDVEYLSDHYPISAIIRF